MKKMQAVLLMFSGWWMVLMMNGCSETKQESQNEKPRVAVSAFALYEAAQAVAGDTLEVYPIIPFGSDAHLFSPDPKAVAKISSSEIFAYAGAGFENWAASLEASLPKDVLVLEFSKSVELIHATVGEEGEHEGDHHDEHNHGAFDPHFWLDIDNMIRVTQTFEAEFSKRFPQNAELYRVNAAAYIKELQKLKKEYQSGLAECQNKTLVSNHNAFGYLAHANHLEYHSVIGLSSDEQPSAKTVAQIASLVKQEGIKTIFFEELIDDHIAHTIAAETGAKTQSLQPLENISEDEVKSHQTYLSIMRQNLQKMREAMECR